MTNKPGWHFLLFLGNCSIAIGSGSFPIKPFSMASRLAVLTLLLVCVVWGAWLNYVVTARVDEGEVQINYFFWLFLRRTTSDSVRCFSLSCGFSCEDILYNYSSYYILKKTLRGRNLSWNISVAAGQTYSKLPKILSSRAHKPWILNHAFLQKALKTLLRLSRVLLDP